MVRMVRALGAELGTEHGTIGRVANQLGCGTESVRLSGKQADIDDGRAPGLSTVEASRLKELEQEVPWWSARDRRAGPRRHAAGDRQAHTADDVTCSWDPAEQRVQDERAPAGEVPQERLPAVEQYRRQGGGAHVGKDHPGPAVGRRNVDGGCDCRVRHIVGVVAVARRGPVADRAEHEERVEEALGGEGRLAEPHPR